MASGLIHIETVEPDRWASRGADVIGASISHAVEARGRAVIALSGGGTPGPVFEDLASRQLPWSQTVFVQVDERLEPPGSPDRNLTAQKEAFASTGARWVTLPVDEGLKNGVVPPGALDSFATELGAVLAGEPLDLVHLGLGADGHMASLTPGDPLLYSTGGVVGQSVEYEGVHRLTLTLAMLNQARLRLWLVRGAQKAEAVSRMVAGDRSVPAGWVTGENSVLVADAASSSLVA